MANGNPDYIPTWARTSITLILAFGLLAGAQQLFDLHKGDVREAKTSINKLVDAVAALVEVQRAHALSEERESYQESYMLLRLCLNTARTDGERQACATDPR